MQLAAMRLDKSTIAQSVKKIIGYCPLRVVEVAAAVVAVVAVEVEGE